MTDKVKNKNLTKEEKIEKAKALMKELKELKLTDEELDKVAGGEVINGGAWTGT